MASDRNILLILEDSFDRMQRFERALESALQDVRWFIANNQAAMLKLIEQYAEETIAISLDHDLYPDGITDAGDGLGVARHLSEMEPFYPVIIHTSNGEQGRRMHGVLDAGGWDVRLAGAIGEHWVENDWIKEIEMIYRSSEA